MTVFNIRGGYGAGKTTIVRELMRLPNLEPWTIEIARPEGSRKQDYVEAHLMPGMFTIVGGDYRRDDLKAAGCDDLSKRDSYAAIHGAPYQPGIVERYHQRAGEILMAGWPTLPDNVLFEGAMISARWGRWAEMAERMYRQGEQTVWCFLDTPLDVQEARVMARSGKSKPPKWGAEYHRRVQRCLEKAMQVPFITVEMLNYLHPVDDFLSVFGRYKGRQRAALHGY